ncbi:Integrase, catalytic core [Gossypium australe]|uniref:Integrase, catalytic core n=1 Tax=Gossypium australe TaxID=47621 RepID=A0A5B6VTN2_9ROSI|nr:Integrase, catalytic core [Gossypium australe]
MIDLGLMLYFLGIELQEDERRFFVSQQKYSNEILKKFLMGDFQAVDTQVECGIKLTKEGDGNLKVQKLLALALLTGSEATMITKALPGSCSIMETLLSLGHRRKKYIASASCVCHISCVATTTIAKNPFHHEESKHIDTRFHFIKEHFKVKEVQLLHVNSCNHVANIFTKALKAYVF